LGDLGYFFLGVGAQIVISLVYVLANVHHLNGPTQHIFGTTHGVVFWAIALMTACGAPFVEEWFFRGTLLPGLAATFTLSPRVAWLTVVIASDGLLFGLAHGEMLQLPGLAAVGALSAWIFIREGRLAPSIALHMGFNTLAVIALFAGGQH
jgi:membrane protease YdiL (CAAX protease family)